MNGRIAIALAAAIGGISPNLLKLATSLTGQGKPSLTVNGGYMVGVLLFAVLGGTVAVIWGEKDPKKAFYLGLGLPSMLQIALSGAGAAQPPSDRTPKESERSAFSLFSTPAYAEPLPQSTGVIAQEPQLDSPPEITFEAPDAKGSRFDVSYLQGRSLTLRVEDLPKGTQLLIHSADGKVTSRLPLPSSDKKRSVELKLPDFAAKLSLQAGDLESKSFDVDLTPGSQTRYKVDLDSKFLGGLLKALGVGHAKPYEFEIKALKPEVKAP